jgi:hypothetical protein
VTPTTIPTTVDTAWRGAGPLRFTSVRDLAKFTAAVALLAILSDAAVGHALLWENDPYWTYWITKTFLIATIFGLGTAWLGAGIARGAVITAVHTLVLTVYYWSLSPIGMPSHPEWLDLQHTWVTGLPVHFGVIYLGYLATLWLWRRRRTAVTEDENDVATVATRALAVGAAIVLVGGLLESLAIGEFPGVTWFVVRILITVPFVLVWWAAAGRDRASAVAGAITLAFILVTYSHFLGPVGLPDSDLRLLAQDPPPATAHWLSYRDEWLVAFPITLLVAVAALVTASRARWRAVHIERGAVLATAATLLLIAGLGAVVAAEAGVDDLEATVTSAGAPQVEHGQYFRGELTMSSGDLRLVAAERNPRVTPLPPHDEVDLEATIDHPDGKRYGITATQPLVDDPMGRFGTWGGVGFDRWHHGRSGLGTPLLPPIRSEVAVFALAEVQADGEVIARGVPVHAMTMPDGGVELAVGDPDTPVPGLPDGHLRAVWHDRSGSSPESHEGAHNTLGSAVLLALVALTVTAIRREQDPSTT